MHWDPLAPDHDPNHTENFPLLHCRRRADLNQ
jgi:hypothetical protein